MREPYDIVVQPIVSEKTARQVEAANTYTFKVVRDANKIEVKRAVEKLFDVTVTGVRTMSYAGKTKRGFMGRQSRALGRRPSFKKAVVTLAEGDHIEFYEAG